MELVDFLPIVQNAAVGVAVGALWYLKNYVHTSSEVFEASTRPVSPDAFSYTDRLAQDLQTSIERFSIPEELRGSNRGRVDIDKVMLNAFRVKNGELIDPNIFIDVRQRSIPVGVGILFSNGVSARDYQGGLPLETSVQSLFDAASSINQVNTGVWAYDNDLHLIKQFDNSHDATVNGILPKHRGYHSKLGFALRQMSELFEDSGKMKVLYVITRPIENRKKQEDVRQALVDLKMAKIKTAFIYLGKEEPSDPLHPVYCVVSRDSLETFPQQVRRINAKL